MSTKQERDEVRRQGDEEDRLKVRRQMEAGLLEDVVADGVMSALGRPAGFLRVAARQVWGDTYRVNVFVGPHGGSARVAHSFFVEADADGRILAAAPPLTREYGPNFPVLWN